MHRFYPDPALGRDGLEYLTPEDVRHALTVLRLRRGAKVEIISGGQPWIGEIERADPGEVGIRKLEPLPTTEPRLQVTLFQGLPKADKMDWIIQKTTELGIIRIVPLNMDRCVSRLRPDDCGKKLERWKKIAREAGKQSGRCVLPEILPPLCLKELPRSGLLPETCIVPWEEARCCGPLSFSKAHPDLTSLGILIGPEGGIDPKEMEFLAGEGWIPVTLGRRILRTETAGIAVLSAIMGLYGEMETA